mmetsp:Transcript_1929/g.5588  ORF Transcript_1929/g.5588 Transcript_1929/m.5588 type:complete len:402 (+) Transcript_1929:242-1447(+)
MKGMMATDSHPKRRSDDGGRKVSATPVGSKCGDLDKCSISSSCSSSSSSVEQSKTKALHKSTRKRGADDSSTSGAAKEPKVAQNDSDPEAIQSKGLVQIEQCGAPVRPPPQPQSTSSVDRLSSADGTSRFAEERASAHRDPTQSSGRVKGIGSMVPPPGVSKATSVSVDLKHLMNSGVSLYPVLGTSTGAATYGGGSGDGSTEGDEKILSAIDAKHESLILPSPGLKLAVINETLSTKTSSSLRSSDVVSELPFVTASQSADVDFLISTTTTSNIKRSSHSSSRTSRPVRWDSVTIQMHPRELGDNPSCSAAGPPITLGWKPVQSRTLDLDRYEERRPERRKKEEMVAPPEQREVRRCLFYLKSMSYFEYLSLILHISFAPFLVIFFLRLNNPERTGLASC